jgi:hypothetical protein
MNKSEFSKSSHTSTASGLEPTRVQLHKRRLLVECPWQRTLDATSMTSWDECFFLGRWNLGTIFTWVLCTGLFRDTLRNIWHWHLAASRCSLRSYLGYPKPQGRILTKFESDNRIEMSLYMVKNALSDNKTVLWNLSCSWVFTCCFVRCRIQMHMMAELDSSCSIVK